MGLKMMFGMANKFAMLFVFAYIITRIKGFRRILGRPALSMADKVKLSVIFGVFGIIGTYASVEYYGALLNTRIIGVAAGGLLGGPIVGFFSGIIAGVHRMVMPSDTVTSFACGVSTIFEGLMAGYMGLLIRDKKHKWGYAALTGAIAEIMRKISLLIFLRPFDLAVETVSNITVPMIVINSLGLALLFMIMENLLRDEEIEVARTAELALDIADRSVVFLKKGIYSDQIQNIASLIYDMSEYTAVTITDCEKILAHVGTDTPRHKVGNPIVTGLTESVLKSGQMKVFKNCPEKSCEFLGSCPLKSVTIFPLIEDGEVIGTIKMYKGKYQEMTAVDQKFAEGLAKLFDTTLTMNSFEQSAQLLKEAELRALQAQINPHFLFNTLTVISSLCRTNPDRARELVYHLSKFFRQNLSDASTLVSVHTEIDHVRSYVEIEKARLGDKLDVTYDIQDNMNLKLPVLSLQPLVENAIKHGIYPKKAPGKVTIEAIEDSKVCKIRISDNGVGMEVDLLNKFNRLEWNTEQSIGLKNVIQRLEGHYGTGCEVHFESTIDKGTSIDIVIEKAAMKELGLMVQR